MRTGRKQITLFSRLRNTNILRFLNLIFFYSRLWPDNKIPFTYHYSIEEVPRWKNMVDRAIRRIEEESCLEFVNITTLMKNHLRDYEFHRYDKNYFTKFKKEPRDHPDFL